jgi:carbon-monoxide dehydrogenase small subunit
MAGTRIRSQIPAQSADPRVPISLTVNGETVERAVSPRLLLSDFLRHELGLTGTHVGCEHGVCGCCTIIMDGRSARSCLTFAVQADGADLRTIEGVADADGTLHPVQQAFMENHALQCGFCTPGVVMSVLSHLEDELNDDLTDGEIRELLSGNLCRCTGYQNMVAAYRRSVELMRQSK